MLEHVQIPLTSEGAALTMCSIYLGAEWIPNSVWPSQETSPQVSHSIIQSCDRPPPEQMTTLVTCLSTLLIRSSTSYGLWEVLETQHTSILPGLAVSLSNIIIVIYITKFTIGTDEPIHLGRTPAINSCSTPLVCPDCPPFSAIEMDVRDQDTTFLINIGPNGLERGYMSIAGDVLQ